MTRKTGGQYYHNKATPLHSGDASFPDNPDLQVIGIAPGAKHALCAALDWELVLNTNYPNETKPLPPVRGLPSGGFGRR